MTTSPISALLAIMLTAFISGSQDIQMKSESTSGQKAAPRPVRDVKVINGPVVRSVSDTSVVITWSTNVTTDTLLHYGKRSDNLDQIARAPRRGQTHSVHLVELTPDTTYYYRVGTSVAQGTEPMTSTASFRTRPTQKAN